MGEEVACRFSITNTHPANDYYVLKWFTPIEGLKYAYMSITKEGKALKYDSIMIKRDRTEAPSSAYQLLKAGHTLNTEIDLSTAYAINKAGKYTAQLQTKLYYHPVVEDAAASTDLEQTLESNSVTFLVSEGPNPRKTLGEIHRQEATMHHAEVQQSGNPLDPKYVSGTPSQRSLTTQIHRASYHYMAAAGDDIDDNQPHYVSWFGAADPNRIEVVKLVYEIMKNVMETDVITYIFNDPRCQPSYYAFTYHGSREVYLCDQYLNSEDILGIDTKLCTIVHELSHAITYTNDHAYGRQKCLNLAKNNPIQAINNGDSYCYFSETTNIFNYGFDSMTLWTNGKYYVTRGNIYLRYSDTSASKIDDGYPLLIYGNWGSLPDEFNAGFDSMTSLLNGRDYVTKGSSYMGYSSAGSYGPYPLQGNWGSLPDDFAAGFDSMTVFPNDKTYVTKGNQYIRYSDPAASQIDPGYPAALSSGAWGDLPPSFAEGFDSMGTLGNKKTYVTKNKEYIRYTGSGTAIDPGYPLPIKGNWGTINFPGPQ